MLDWFAPIIFFSNKLVFFIGVPTFYCIFSVEISHIFIQIQTRKRYCKYFFLIILKDQLEIEVLFTSIPKLCAFLQFSGSD